MKKLCRETSADDCNRLKTQLDDMGIECTVKAVGSDPLFDRDSRNRPSYELWIVNDDDFEKAWAFLNRETPPGNGVE